MKSILETSIYLIVMSFISLISLDFISMNTRVSKVNELAQYTRDVAQIYGESSEEHILDNDTIDMIQNHLSPFDVAFSYSYFQSSDTYDYYRFRLDYSMKSRIFAIDRKQYCTGIIRTARKWEDI